MLGRQNICSPFDKDTYLSEVKSYLGALYLAKLLLSK